MYDIEEKIKRCEKDLKIYLKHHSDWDFAITTTMAWLMYWMSMRDKVEIAEEYLAGKKIVDQFVITNNEVFGLNTTWEAR